MSELGCQLARQLFLEPVYPPEIADSERPIGPSRPISEWRSELVKNREQIIGKPGFYLDRSATGTGKSTADIEAVRLVKRGLIVVPTHENAGEVERDMQLAGLPARKFPARKTGGDHVNCWNGSAEFANSMGLSVVASVCPYCEYRSKCSKEGYLGQSTETKSSPIAISTHARGIYNGIDELASGRGDYIAIHEDPAGVMCPDEAASHSDLKAASEVLTLILSDPTYLDWLGQSARKDYDGNLVPDDKLAERRERIDQFVRHLADVLDLLIQRLESATKTQAITIPESMAKPSGTDNLLLRVIREAEVVFSASPWRLLLAAAMGELHSIGVIVDDSRANRKWPVNSPKRRVIVGAWRNRPSDNSVVLFADATADKGDLESYLGRSVIDITPDGHIERSKRVVQFAKDITRKTSANSFLGYIRAVMCQFPNAQRVGVITHRTLVKHLSEIGEPFASRIVKKTYFGSGSDRASNDWHTQCDLIIVPGTPRVRSLAMQRRLIQISGFVPAGENSNWGEVQWRGQTESGNEMIVSNRGYQHPLWAKASRSLVRATIIQATGRGRPLLDCGCDVAIVSTEECGFPLADEAIIALLDTELNVLTHLGGASAGFLPNKKLSAANANILSKSTPPLTSSLAVLPPITPSMTTQELSQSIGLSERRTREVLNGLESRGLVVRIGKRGGWTISTHSNP